MNALEYDLANGELDHACTYMSDSSFRSTLRHMGLPLRSFLMLVGKLTLYNFYGN